MAVRGGVCDHEDRPYADLILSCASLTIVRGSEHLALKLRVRSARAVSATRSGGSPSRRGPFSRRPVGGHQGYHVDDLLYAIASTRSQVQEQVTRTCLQRLEGLE